MSRAAQVHEAEVAAGEAYDAIRGAHAVDYDARWPRHADGSSDWDTPRVDRCICGWAPKAHVARRNRTRALGLHIGAAERRASKAWDAAYDAKLAE